MNFYFLSLGSNLEPEFNLGLAVEAFLVKFRTIGLYPFRFTEPEGMESENLFVNGVCIIHSDVSHNELKAWTNEVEVFLGRDRSDPLRDRMDRTCDIDILCQSKRLNAEKALKKQGGYVKTIILGESETEYSSPSVKIFGITLPNRAATIDFKRCSSNKPIIYDGHDHLKNRAKSRLHL
jgi:2-amino-4-hydroxy-6-hydroxymethyldihydropteridine diphosphokinase